MTFLLSDAGALLLPRDPESHKGTYGHGLLIAGSKGMAGAAVMAAQAALRSGIGLLTVCTPECNRIILQTAVPEAMVIACGTDFIEGLPDNLSRYTAIAIGPGMTANDATRRVQQTLLEKATVPIVLDADALNNLAADPALFALLNETDILTPHPGEYKRLKEANPSIETSRDFYLILKGHLTRITSPQNETSLNTTGNPGMATGGSGDVLTGILLALRAQGLSAWDAARLGVFVHGLAGDLAAESLTDIAMTATDIIRFLPHAWRIIQHKP